MASPTPDETIGRAHDVFIQLALAAYITHFRSPTYFNPSTLDMLDKRVGKETLKATSSTSSSSHGAAIRKAIGENENFWWSFNDVLSSAVPSLEKRSFDPLDEDPKNGVDYESARGALIASHYPGLWRDLERLNDIVSIGRNVLTAGERSQLLAAECGTESEVFRLIHVCVRVTARGYDAEAGTQEEEKWQWVVNAYKKVLITALQFLNNVAARNEERKMRLWLRLFDSPASSEGEEEGEQQAVKKPPPPPPPPPPPKPEPPYSSEDVLLAYGTTGPQQQLSPYEMQAAQPLYKKEGFKGLPKVAQAEVDGRTYRPNAYTHFVRHTREKCIADFHRVHKRSPMLAEIHKNLPRYWWEKVDSEYDPKYRIARDGHGSVMWERWSCKFRMVIEDYQKKLQAWEIRDSFPAEPVIDPISAVKSRPWEGIDSAWFAELEFEELEEYVKKRLEEAGPTTAPEKFNFAKDRDKYYNPCDPKGEDEAKDLKMGLTAEAGKKILESGKIELMRRLEGSQDGRRRSTSGQRFPPLARSEATGGTVSEMYDSINKTRVEEERRTGRRRTSEPSVLHPNAHPNGPTNQEEADDTLSITSTSTSHSSASSSESYPGSSEDGRGLLTDVPLILGPSEIEVLPMLIMSGIVIPPPAPEKYWLYEDYYTTPPPNDMPWEDTSEGQGKLREWHDFRTKLLLSQTSGRNLLRELLIFVAAWDLREEELYFKFMVKICEAILKAGLMPFAYHSFRDRSKSKDIISPAQAVLIKLLTSIFRQRNQTFLSALQEAHTHPHQAGEGYGGEWKCHHPLFGPIPRTLWLARTKWQPRRADLCLMSFIFGEFRQHIIPQTCALIFLQGQVKRGRATSDDFPLNLWDMERMYEGVYQVLEFFAAVVEEVPSSASPGSGGATTIPPAPSYGPSGGPAHPLGGFWVDRNHENMRVENERLAEMSKQAFAKSPEDARAQGWDREKGVPSPEIQKLEREGKTAEYFSWKTVLAGWEMAAELVTLLRELEEGIPKSGGQSTTMAAQSTASLANYKVGAPNQYLGPLEEGEKVRPLSPEAAASASATLAEMKKVYNALDAENNAKLAQRDTGQAHGTGQAPPPPNQVERPFDTTEGAESALAYPASEPFATNPAGLAGAAGLGGLPGADGSVGAPLSTTHDQDEPADFEWRNLKKLTVLVLSSLVWKNQQVQDQLRECGGLEVLLRCCREDENNPFIREHAIMCLRFAVEGNAENREAIKELAEGKGFDSTRAEASASASNANGSNEEQSAVVGSHGKLSQGQDGDMPSEILDEGIYETYMDPHGRVGLRRREQGTQSLNTIFSDQLNREDFTTDGVTSSPSPSTAHLDNPANTTLPGSSSQNSTRLDGSHPMHNAGPQTPANALGNPGATFSAREQERGRDPTGTTSVSVVDEGYEAGRAGIEEVEASGSADSVEKNAETLDSVKAGDGGDGVGSRVLASGDARTAASGTAVAGSAGAGAGSEAGGEVLGRDDAATSGQLQSLGSAADGSGGDFAASGTSSASTIGGSNRSHGARLVDSDLTAEKAAELMQNALRNLPLGEKLVTDRQKAEALAKLDRAFEGAEKALGVKGGNGSGNGKKGGK